MQRAESKGGPQNLDPARVKRVLIYRLGSLGDTVVALPALHLVKRAFAGARLHMLTNIPVHTKAPPAAAVLEGSGLVDGYISYPIATRSFSELAAVWWAIRRFRPDLLVYLMPPRGERGLQRDVGFFRFCGIRRFVGLPTGDLGKNRFDEKADLFEQESKRLLRCLRALGEAEVDDLHWWDLRLSQEDERRAIEAISPLAGRRLIACGPGTKMQAKDWGPENWKMLLSRLATEFHDYGLVLVGAKQDAEVSEHTSGAWDGRRVNLCGSLTPRQTAAVLGHTELFLGPDSGPMHLAAVVGVPCAIAFAARDKRGKWYPIGAGNRIVYRRIECEECQLEVCIERKRKCLTSISVDEMFAAAMDAWKNGNERTASQVAQGPAGGKPCIS